MTMAPLSLGRTEELLTSPSSLAGAIATETWLGLAGLLISSRTSPVSDTPTYMAWKTNNKGRALRWFVDALTDPAVNHDKQG